MLMALLETTNGIIKQYFFDKKLCPAAGPGGWLRGAAGERCVFCGILGGN